MVKVIFLERYTVGLRMSYDLQCFVFVSTLCMVLVTDQPIDPAIIVLALTSFLTFVLVVIGFVIGRSRYLKSRYDKPMFL